MYLGALHGGVSEFANVDRVPWTQELVDARWREIGQSPPAPLVPASMVGWYRFTTRGPRMLTKSPTGKLHKSSARHVTREENDFLNFFNKVAVDPFRKQGTVSKVAGAALQVVGVAVPVFGYFQAAQAAGNAAIDYKSQGGDAALAMRVMTPAIDAQLARENAAAVVASKEADDALKRQLEVLRTASTSILPVLPALTPQAVSASTSVLLPMRPEKSYFGLTQNQLVIAALALLGVVLWRKA